MIAVSSLRKAMQQMVAKKGDFTLFALLRRDEPLYGLWDLVVAAPWMKSDTLAATREVVGFLAKSIGTKGLQQLARVAVIADDNPTVKFFLKNVPVEKGERRIQRTDLFGLQIEEGIIFRAKRPEPAKPGRKVVRSTSSGSSQRVARKHAVLERT